MSIEKDKYRELCNKEDSIHLFQKAWWLDAVCGESNWDVALVEKGGKIVACLPFFIKKKLWFKVLSMPPFTQTLGLWIDYPDNQKNTTRLSFEKDVITELISKLPKYTFFKEAFHYDFKNWLPFFWNGFSQTTAYTYLLEGLKDLDNIFAGFRQNIKTDIRKAEKVISVKEDDDIEKFYQINKMTFDRQKLKVPYSFEQLKRLYEACFLHSSVKLFFAEDNEGLTHSALFLVWDKNSAYYLMGGGDPALRNSGATSFLIWKAIQFASTIVDRFDFEGSMLEPVERFVRAFGAEQKSIFKITKNNSRFLKLFFFLKDL